MFRSLHMKLVLVLVLLIISVMAVVGAFLMTSVTDYNIQDFEDQMRGVFTQEFIAQLEREAAGENAAPRLRSVMETYSARLGIDSYRAFYVLDAQTHEFIVVSDESFRSKLMLTPNIINALEGESGYVGVDRMSPYFDAATPVRVGGQVKYVVGVMDSKDELSSITLNLFTSIIRSMLFGLVASVLFSFLLSKTITNPVERLTEQAAKIASGDFGARPEIYSTDEIGVLTQTFNEMSEVLESTLHEAESERDKLNTLFLHMADGVVAFDSAGRLLHVNPAARRMLGRDVGLGMLYADIFPNIQVDEADFNDDNRLFEVDYAAKNRILKILLAPINVGERDPGVMAVLHDITEERKLDQSRREFVANVSHELRTPLTNIKGYTETLLTIEDIDKETERQFLGVVCGEADRMTRIVKDLLTLSRLDYNRMEMKMERMDLRALALEAQRSMEITAKNQSITITETMPGRMPHIYADRERIEQVLINIISNAVKYNKPNGSITISGGWNDSSVYIVVEDTGIGVPAEDIPRVFERFYRVDKARSRESGGTGMGLSIAREIVESHGGEITFDSELGKGSRVTVIFPRDNAAHAGGESHA